MEKEYDIVAMGELLIDFTPAGVSETGMCLYERNPGGAPVNMLTAAAKAGLRTAFIGKVGNDMHGKFLIEAVENQNINSDGIILDDNVFTTLAFVNLTKDGERSFSFARKPGAVSSSDNLIISANGSIERIRSIAVFSSFQRGAL